MTRNILPKSEEAMMRIKARCGLEPTSIVQIASSSTTTANTDRTSPVVVMASNTTNSAMMTKMMMTNRVPISRQIVAKPSFSTTTNRSGIKQPTSRAMSSEEDEEMKSKVVGGTGESNTTSNIGGQQDPTTSTNHQTSPPVDSNYSLTGQQPPPFSRTRLTQWHSNEEIYSILTQCSQLLSSSSSSTASRTLLNEWLSGEECIMMRRPSNGSVFLFDRRRVKNFKKDGFSWKRRKTGGANSVREDRMYLKINGVDKIYGCYSHSAIISTFHRRCYWLLDKPDLVLVHYLHTPNSETGECVVNLTGAGVTSNATDQDQSQSQLNKDDLLLEIKAMLWPYYLNEQFIQENAKLCPEVKNNNSNTRLSPDEFLIGILGNLLASNPVRIVLNSLTSTSSSSSSSAMTYDAQSNRNILDESNQSVIVDTMKMKNRLQSDNSDNNNNAIESCAERINNLSPCFNPNPSERQQPSTSSDKQVFLSTNSCSANGGEKLMLIGNWADNKSTTTTNQEMNSSTTKPDNNKNTVKYTINLNGVEIKLNQLNKHVLECNLPRFEWMFGNKQQQAATNSVQIQANSNEEFIYKTYVYLYENGSLYCPPIAFEIKYNLAYSNRSLNLKADTTNKSMDQTSSVNLEGETSYKNQLFLLERSLILGKIYGVSQFEYGSYNNSNTSEENYSSLTSSSLRRNVSFEKRICQMIDGLREHLKSRTRKNLVTADSSLSRMDFNLSNEHEGKTLLHICAESSLNELFECLRRLKSTLDGFSQNDSPELGLIRNELKLFQLDHHGYTPLMLACKNGSTKIALELFEWHKSEFEMDKNRLSSFAPPTSTVTTSTGFSYQPALFASSSWYFDMINSIGEANKHSHRELASKLDTLLREYQTEYESTRNNRATTSNTQQDEDLCCSTSSAGPSSTSSSNISSNSPSKTYLESIDAIKKQIISSCEAQPQLQQINRIVTDDLNIPSPSMNSLMIDENFRLIENLDVLSCLLADESVELNENQSNKPALEQAKQSVHEENIDLMLGDDENMMQHDASVQSPLTQTMISRQPLQQQQSQQSSLFAMPKPSPPTSSGGVGGVAAATKQIDDDQDKKIKTLADNIIAAMPHKIKTNSYSTTRADSVGSTSATNLNNNNTVGESSAGSPFRPMNLMRRETTSFDDNYDPGISLSSCYSSSTRSSISPSSSLSYQFTGPFGPNSRFIDDQQPNSRQFSPSHNNTNSSSNNNDESTCSSTFHIDSPPSTAEFSQYFHAGSSSSAYFRNAIETGFAQLTLTDDEQRELYEAALVIQNAYRRYIQRKKKKIRLDESLLPPSDSADSTNAIIAKDDTVNVNTSPDTAALILETSSKLENMPNFNPFSKIMSAINLTFSIQQQQQQQKTAMIVENTTTNSLINSTEMSISVSAQQTSPPQTVAAAVMQQQAQELTQQKQQQIPVKLETITTSKNGSDGNNTTNRADVSVASVAVAAATTAATKSSSRHDDSNLSDDDESNSINEEEQRQYQAACIIQKYYRRYKQFENLQKYNDAAVKIQTRYRAYQQYKSGAKAKLRSHYQHNSIDETSIMGGETQPYCNGCCGGCCAAATAAAVAAAESNNNNNPVNSANGEECECVNCRRLIGSDMQLNCHHHHYHYAQHPLYQTTTHHHYTHYHNCSHHRHYHCDANSSNSHQYTASPMINQKMISWKIMPNVRHSPRYSPASSTSFLAAPQPSPNSPGAFQNPLSVASESGVLPRRKISDIEPAVLNNNMMNDVITNFDFDSNNPNLQNNQPSPFLVNNNGMMSEGSSDKMSAFHQLANNSLFSTSVDNNNNNNNKIGEQHHNYSLNQSNFWTYLTKANVNLKSSSFIKPTHRVHKKSQYLNSTNQPTLVNFSSSNLMENNSLSSPFMIYNSNMDNHMDFNITEESSCLKTTTTANNQFMFNLADNNNNNTNNSTNNSLTIASFSSPKSSTSNINENQATNNNNMNLIREDDNEMI